MVFPWPGGCGIISVAVAAGGNLAGAVPPRFEAERVSFGIGWLHWT